MLKHFQISVACLLLSHEPKEVTRAVWIPEVKIEKGRAAKPLLQVTGTGRGKPVAIFANASTHTHTHT